MGIKKQDMIARVKKSERSKSIPLADAIKISEQWIKKYVEQPEPAARYNYPTTP